MENNHPPILKIEHLKVHYGPILALNNVSLKLKKGEIVALLGSNGAGKSTLLKTIIGIQKLSQGAIFYYNRQIGNLTPDQITRSGLCLIPEERGIFGSLTVEENLQLGAYYFSRDYQQNFNKTTQLFPILKKRLTQVAGTLSGGEQRILAIGKALMSNSEILMLDEPSLGLSPKLVFQIFEILVELNQKGYTILLAEQNARQSFNIAHRVYIMEKGHIVLQGNPEELKNHPGILKAYLGQFRESWSQT